jgi:hypothetical protein
MEWWMTVEGLTAPERAVELEDLHCRLQSEIPGWEQRLEQKSGKQEQSREP